MQDWLSLIRVRQWYKNLLCLAPLLVFGSGLSLHWTEIAGLLLAFCYAASAVYIVNDVIDRHCDRKQPDRKMRPIARGSISCFSALSIGLVLVCLALFLWPSVLPLRWLLMYWALNVLYCFFVKPLVGYGLISAVIITLGYLTRLMPASDGLTPLALSVAMVSMAVVAWKQRSYLYVHAGAWRYLKLAGFSGATLFCLLLIMSWGVGAVVLMPIVLIALHSIISNESTRDPVFALSRALNKE